MEVTLSGYIAHAGDGCRSDGKTGPVVVLVCDERTYSFDVNNDEVRQWGAKLYMGVTITIETKE